MKYLEECAPWFGGRNAPKWMQPDIIARFSSKVERGPDGECWPWLAVKDRLGYGRFNTGRGVTVQANRFSLAASSAWPEGAEMHACHTCDNRSCCNPGHLFWGTRKDNMSDCARKGRLAAQKATHCPQGHPYFGNNLYIMPRTGARACKICRYERSKAAQMARQVKAKSL